MVKFPPELPAPLISSNQVKQTQSFSRTQMKSGRTRQRRTHRVTPANANFSFVMTSEQIEIFEKWYAEEINSGADWFEIKRLTASGYLPLKARFRSMYQGANPVGLSDKWSISFGAEVYTDIYDGNIWEFPDYVKNQCLLDCVVNVLWPSEFNDYIKDQCLLDCSVNEIWVEDE